LAAHVLKVRRSLLVAVAGMVAETDRVALDALAVVLPKRRLLRLFQRLERVAMFRRVPNLEFTLMAALAALGADECRVETLILERHLHRVRDLREATEQVLVTHFLAVPLK